MIEKYITIKKEYSAEIVVKKSRFIAVVAPAANEDEAAAVLSKIRKENRDARHNCSAFIVGHEARLCRSSDDGEPQGTAGKPMLEILDKKGFSDVIGVVTRYFGGILLGTGGLVRAYSSALEEAVAKCDTIEMKPGAVYEVTTGYTDIGKILRFIENAGIRVLSSDYLDVIRIKVLCPISVCDSFEANVKNISLGKAIIEKVETGFFEM